MYCTYISIFMFIEPSEVERLSIDKELCFSHLHSPDTNCKAIHI